MIITIERLPATVWLRAEADSAKWGTLLLMYESVWLVSELNRQIRTEGKAASRKLIIDQTIEVDVETLRGAEYCCHIGLRTDVDGKTETEMLSLKRHTAIELMHALNNAQTDRAKTVRKIECTGEIS